MTVEWLVRRGGSDSDSDSGGVPVLLLHGVPQTGAMWAPLVALLGDRRTLVPDLPGLGGSGPTPAYDVVSLAAELAALVAAEVPDVDGRSGRVDVVGHDWGGILALALAGHHPERVRRLAVANAPYRDVDPTRAWHVPLAALPWLPERLLTPQAVRWGIAHVWRSPVPPSRELLDRYAAAYDDPARVRATLAYYRAAARHTDRRLRMTGMPDVAPTEALVVWGAEDPVLPLAIGESVVRGIAARVPAVRMVTVPGAGHFVVDEAPEVVLPVLADFLA